MPELGPLGNKIIGKTPEGRAIVLNPDGSVSTERTITVQHPRLNDGRWTNIPTMFGGKAVDEDEAVRRIIEADGKDPETGNRLQGFSSQENAEAVAVQRSKELGLQIDGIMNANKKRSLITGGF